MYSRCELHLKDDSYLQGTVKIWKDLNLEEIAKFVLEEVESIKECFRERGIFPKKIWDAKKQQSVNLYCLIDTKILNCANVLDLPYWDNLSISDDFVVVRQGG
jgi:hypothetical protein